MNTRMMSFAVAVAALICAPTRANVLEFAGSLDAAQVVDGGGSASTATGFATVTIDTLTEVITTDLSWFGLSGPADRAHLHDAPFGQSRENPPNNTFFEEVLVNAFTMPCAWGLYGQCAPATGSVETVDTFPNGPSFFLTPVDFATLLGLFETGGIYIDMHTQLYPSGEIRGQLYAVPEPGSLTLLGLGGLAAFAAARRRTSRWVRTRASS
jgi:CHRD domain/PEP-CTERM motif